MIMKKKIKKLSLDQAAKEMAAVIQPYLDRLPPTEKKKRVRAFNRLAAEAHSRLQDNSPGTGAMPGAKRRTPGREGVAQESK